MPGIAHICISLGLCIMMNRFTRGKFGIKHSLIFTFNSLIGPDLMSLFFSYSGTGYLFTHGYGWFLPAIPISLVWCIYTFYAVQTKPFKIQKRDPQKELIINYPEVYCLVAAGGIFHQMVDIIGHPAEIMYEGELTPWGAVWFGGDNYFSIYSIWGTGMFPCGNELGFPEFYIFAGIFLAIALIIIFKFMHRSEKMFIKSSILLILIYFIPLLVAYFIPDYSGFDIYDPNVTYFGDPSYIPSVYRLTGGEADFGVMVFFFLFFFVPLVLLYYGYNGVPGLKKSTIREEIEKIEREEHERAQARIKELLNSRT